MPDIPARSRAPPADPARLQSDSPEVNPMTGRLKALWLRLVREERGGMDSLVYIVIGLLFAAAIYVFMNGTALPAVTSWLQAVINKVTAIQ